MSTGKFIYHTLVITFKTLLFFVVMVGCFWLLNKANTLLCLSGVVFMILNIVITIRYLILKSKSYYLNFKNKHDETN